MIKTVAKEYEVVEEILSTLQQALFDILFYFEDSPYMAATADEIIDDFDRLIFYSQECRDVLGSVDETA